MLDRRHLAWLGSVAALACERNPGSDARPESTTQEPVGALTAARAAEALPSALAPSALGAMASEPSALAPQAQTTPAAVPSSRCNEQAPQRFLIKAHFDSFLAEGGTAQEWKRVLNRAVRYRTEKYGYVQGFGSEAWNASTPSEQARVVTFFGVSVSIHGRVAPALSCVETAIRAHCGEYPYQPFVLSGLRRRNTYVNGEISNHVYGIALDVDPTRNPCCGCIGGWGQSERCRNDKNKFERMEMPRCWVTQFERFGFYWLGHDKIEDTMHFEFLGEPNQIVRSVELVP